jgi:hypothetical protein
MENTDIFIFSQGVPKIYPKSSEYKLVSIEKIDEPCDIEKVCLSDKPYCDDKLLKMEHSYSECARIHAIWKYYPLQKYVGTAHYRRYLKFFDNLPNLDEIFAKHDVIFQKFDTGWSSVRENYGGCHNIDDLERCVTIIKWNFPEFAKAADEVLYDRFLTACNVFLTTRELFSKWCEFLFAVLEKYDEEMGFKTDLDVYNHVVNNLSNYTENKGGPPNSLTTYQSRIQAFLSERISTIFFKKMAKNPYYCDMVITEINYDFEKTYFNQYEK